MPALVRMKNPAIARKKDCGIRPTLFCYRCKMANTINIPKTHVIMGLSLPLAVLIGYFLAEPMELGSIAVVVLVIAVLCVPLMLRWYYPMLVFCWNASIAPIFFPGRPALWSVLAFGGLLIAVLSRAVNAKAKFLNVPSITKPLLALLVVIMGTAMLTGGIGVHALGSDTYGGKKYYYIFAGIAGYFVLTSRRIPPERAGLYVGLFFLSGLSNAMADFAYRLGPQARFLLAIFGSDYAADQALAEQAIVTHTSSIVRMGGMGWLATALYTYMLARFGIRGLLDFQRPWRIIVFGLAFLAGLAGGFRSFVAVFALVTLALFYIEGLHRTRYLPAIMGIVLMSCAVILPQAHKLPLVAQRALSFLPGKFDVVAVESAKISTNWRLEMWKQVLPDVPRYLIRGKGYALDANDLYMAMETSTRLSIDPLAGTIAAGDYHSGPLSVIIPFGIFGTAAFLWFLGAGFTLLNRTFKRSTPALRNVNALLLAAFAAHVFFFFFGFGSLHSDLPMFTGFLGLSVALNGTGDTMVEPAEEAVTGAELKTEYIRM